MKIFDDKGRLFSIFNIVDICIIIFIVAAAVGAYTYISNTVKTSKTTEHYSVTLEIKAAEDYLVEAMQTDRKVFDHVQNKRIGTIEAIRSKPAVEYRTSTLDGKQVEAKVPDCYDVEIDMDITADGKFYVGKRMSIATKDFVGAGYIIKCEKSE